MPDAEPKDALNDCQTKGQNSVPVECEPEKPQAPTTSPVSFRSRRRWLVIVASIPAFSLLALATLWLLEAPLGSPAFEERYPLSKALATSDFSGLLVAIHEVQPLEQGGCFVVSSVRPTREWLKHNRLLRTDHYRLNSGIRVIDTVIASLTGEYEPPHQIVEDTFTGDTHFHWIALGQAKKNGVQYVWWLFLPRKFYHLVDGKRVPITNAALSEEHRLLTTPKDSVRIAFHLADPGSHSMHWYANWVDVALPPDAVPRSMPWVAERTRSDLLFLQKGTKVALVGCGARTSSPRFSPFDPMTRAAARYRIYDPQLSTTAQFAVEIQNHIDNFLVRDEIGGASGDTIPSGAGDRFLR